MPVRRCSWSITTWMLGISDYVVVLDFGKVIAQGRPMSSVVTRVIEAYLGSAAAEPSR